MDLSVVVPIHNEKENIVSLVKTLHDRLTGLEYEIILVDDGSNDGTVEEMLLLNDPAIHLLLFSRNFGQTSALAAGIEAARGRYIATLDGDLQNDPADIPLMLSTLKQGNYDMVTGRRVKRQDGLFLRKIPSQLANYLIRTLTDVHIHDYGCTLKLFRAEFAKNLELYGELHRFIPVLGTLQGARIAEVDVRHHPRIHGVSKYGIGRTLRVLCDLLLMVFFQKYQQKPMHLFGGIGLIMLLLGMAIQAYLLALKITGEAIGNRPLFYVGIVLIITAIQLITTGFLAELIMRTYYGVQKKKPYCVVQRFHTGKATSKEENNTPRKP